MAISQQNKTQIIRLIAEGECLNVYDLEEFYGWMEASYEALKLNPRLRNRFDEYCRSSCDSTSLRVCAGVLMLKDALNDDSPDCAAMDARV
jgi:hypothetical protein